MNRSGFSKLFATVAFMFKKCFQSFFFIIIIIIIIIIFFFFIPFDGYYITQSYGFIQLHYTYMYIHARTPINVFSSCYFPVKNNLATSLPLSQEHCGAYISSSLQVRVGNCYGFAILIKVYDVIAI
jgi:hypothetical protein